VNLPPVALKGNTFAVFVAVVDKRNPELWQTVITEHQLAQLLPDHRPLTHVVAEPKESDVFNDVRFPPPLASVQEPFSQAGVPALGSMPTALPNIEASYGAWNVSRRVPQAVHQSLKKVFDYQAIVTPDMEYDALKGLFATFFLAYQVLFIPFAEVERKNIFRRLVSLFGVPQSGEVLENLAVRCAMIVLSRDHTDGGLGGDSRSLNMSSSAGSGGIKAYSDTENED
jgi:hypothetical protein